MVAEEDFICSACISVNLMYTKTHITLYKKYIGCTEEKCYLSELLIMFSKNFLKYQSVQ